jgi:hypothetical protein
LRPRHATSLDSRREYSIGAAAQSIPADRPAPAPAGDLDLDIYAALQSQIRELQAEVRDLARVIRDGAVAPIGTPAEAARVLRIGASRIQRACRAAEAAGASVILSDIPFRRIGGGSTRPRYGIFMPHCVRSVAGG